MKIAGINYESISDGEGVRATIFISGCKHNCNGCFNKQVQDFNYGKELTKDFIEEISNNLKDNIFLSGITLSGGDPFFQPLEVLDFIKQIYIPKNNIWCYTGFTYEEILKDKDKLKLLKHIDVLVDGKFEEDKKDATLKFRGSSNQRIINVTPSLLKNEIIYYMGE